MKNLFEAQHLERLKEASPILLFLLMQELGLDKGRVSGLW